MAGACLQLACTTSLAPQRMKPGMRDSAIRYAPKIFIFIKLPRIKKLIKFWIFKSHDYICVRLVHHQTRMPSCPAFFLKSSDIQGNATNSKQTNYEKVFFNFLVGISCIFVASNCGGPINSSTVGQEPLW